MPRKTPDEMVRLIKELYANNLSVAEIARRANVSYPTAYGYTKAEQRGFASRNEYRKHLAKENGFASLNEYKKHLAKERGFASITEYKKHLVEQRGFASITEYNKHLAKERGFASITEYEKHLAKQRQERPINQELSNLIKRRLKELGKNQSWLAEEVRVTRQAVSLYVKRKSVPNEEILCKLYSALDVPYQTLDDLLEDIE